MMDWLFFGPAKLIALWPHTGLVIGAILLAIQAVLHLRAGRPLNRDFFREAPALAGLLWLIFGFYERQVTALKVLPGEAGTPFRIDLLVLTPILYVLTVAALLSIARQWRSRNGRTKE